MTMNQSITDLADQLRDLFKQLMATDPWEQGYGEVAAIHENLLRVIRDKAQTDIGEFSKYLESAAKEIEQTWSSSKNALAPWKAVLGPVFTQVEKIIGKAVPLLSLLI